MKIETTIPFLAFGATCILSGAVFAQKSDSDIVDTAVNAGSFENLATALQKADLIKTLKGKGPFTVFAPTDAAFAKLPKGTVESLLEPENKNTLTSILTYHVVSGNMPAAMVVKQKTVTTLNGQRVSITVDKDGARIGGAKIIETDIHCTNGVIHVIDAVIQPVTDDILTVASKAGSFKTLAAAIKAAGLVDTLSGKGPFTVFAPTDAAFAKLPKGTVESLLAPENKAKLISILTYHVVSGRNYADKVMSSPKLTSLQGSPISFKMKKGTAMANDARIVSTDIEASNGAIHVIDSVIMPPAKVSGTKRVGQ
jgi:uncharacterized surface protein with fasciclin (FAS1) repeats